MSLAKHVTISPIAIQSRSAQWTNGWHADGFPSCGSENSSASQSPMWMRHCVKGLKLRPNPPANEEPRSSRSRKRGDLLFESASSSGILARAASAIPNDMPLPLSPQAPLPQFLCDMLAAPPRHGDGVHQWLYRLARQLHAHRGETDICELLSATLSGCGRDVPAREIEDAVRASRATAWQPNGKGSNPPRLLAQPKWPPINAELRARVVAEIGGIGVEGLRQMSPCRLDDRRPNTNEVVAALFPPDSFICAGMDKWSAATAPLSERLRQDMAKLQLIVPSPMSALTGTNKEGRESARCLDNTGPRRFLVVECDHGTIDEQAGILWWLAQRAPLALAVHSGGKSLHGWFYCAGRPEEKLLAFMRLAVSLGADPAMWTRCQLARMPGGTRPTTAERPEVRQEIFYFNPSICI